MIAVAPRRIRRSRGPERALIEPPPSARAADVAQLRATARDAHVDMWRRHPVVVMRGFPRRQQHRRLRRAIASGATAVAAGALAVIAASAGALAVTGVLSLMMV